MKTRLMLWVLAIVLFAACKKKEPQLPAKTVAPVSLEIAAEFGKEIIADKPVKVGETGILLPAGTKIWVATNNSEIKVELPTGYSFEVSGGISRPLPIGIATYHCICSGGGACQVVFIDELGFGCVHSSCSGGCTGAFTYRGYSINRVVRINEGKEKFLADPAIQKEIIGQYKLIHPAAGISSEEYAPQHIYGVIYYFQLPATASCDCDGTKACTLKTLGIAMDKTGTQSFKIYYCDGPCNGCELTVN